jgi:hypothetical protein
MPATAFPQDPALTALAIAYRNPDAVLIADAVLPRTPVASTLFSYTSFNDLMKAFTLPNTQVGPTGRVNRLELDGQRVPGETSDEAIDVPLSFYDVNASGQNVNARELATQLGASIIQLRREVRVANLVFSGGTYPEGYKEQLSGDEQWDDDDYAGNALKTIAAGLDVPLIRPNAIAFGPKSWSVFRQLPEVVKAVHGNNGDTGFASRQAVADLLEVQEVLVGSGWLNTAKPGEAPNKTRAWGNHVAAFYRDRTAATVGGLTFGFTAEYGKRVAGSLEDKMVGMRGGELVRTGESVKELVVAPHAAYFWEDVVAG